MRPATSLLISLVGEPVRVKSKEEIAKKLTPGGRHKRMWFDCKREGKLLVLKNQPVTLKGVVCTDDSSIHNWLRAVYPYWHECWLERISMTSSGYA
jgi:hypothetical protein